MKKLNHLVTFSVTGLLLTSLLMNWDRLISYSVSASQLFSSLVEGGSQSSSAAERVKPARINDAYGRLPMSFELNQGQGDPNVRYLARGRGYQILLNDSEAVLRLRRGSNKLRSGGKNLRSDAVSFAIAGRTSIESESRDWQSETLRIKLEGASPANQIIGLDPLPGKSNYLIGADPEKWHKNIPNYSRVEYRGVYPGVNLAYYGSQQSLEYDFIVTPGYDPGVITIGFEGVEQVELAGNGDLALHLNGAVIYQRNPVIYQQTATGRRTVTGRYALRGDKQVGIVVGDYDSSKPLVIDPVLEYSTYLGGGGDDTGQSIKVDGSGAAYIAGVTFATDFMTIGAAQTVSKGGADIFITKLNASGDTIIYSTYLGAPAMTPRTESL